MMKYVGFFLGVLWVIGAFYLLHRGIERMFAEEKRRSRSPFKEKLLRPAGESLRLKIEEIRERFMEEALIFTGLSVFFGIAIICITTPNWVVNGIAWTTLGTIGFFSCRHRWRKLKAIRKEIRQYRLGFDGERYVAEKLSQVAGQGYRVFHDFLFDMKPGGEATNFNFDHILVGPAGVILVETKAYRQPNEEFAGGDESHRVRGEGDYLVFPGNQRRRSPLDQVRRNSKELSKWLTGSSEKVVPVFPIVTLPGWYTEEDSFPDLLVLNPKRIPTRVSRMRKVENFTSAEIRAIGDRIEAQCRNVDGA